MCLYVIFNQSFLHYVIQLLSALLLNTVMISSVFKQNFTNVTCMDKQGFDLNF